MGSMGGGVADIHEHLLSLLLSTLPLFFPSPLFFLLLSFPHLSCRVFSLNLDFLPAKGDKQSINPQTFMKVLSLCQSLQLPSEETQALSHRNS